MTRPVRGTRAAPRHSTARRVVVGSVIAATAVLTAPAALPAAASTATPTATAAAPLATRAPKSGAVQVQVERVEPAAPRRTTKPAPLTIDLRLHNTTDTPLRKVQIDVLRGDPIGNQHALDKALHDTTAPKDALTVRPTRKVTVDLPAGGDVEVTFPTATSILVDKGLCLCDNTVYPLFVRASTVDDGSTVTLGSTATWTPSIFTKVSPVGVSWVWPLIDRPHRLEATTVFRDDSLAASVSSGGRLDHLLRTLERLPHTVPITVVIDPELLDELEIMASGKYTVVAAGGKTPTAGTGRSAAVAWLARLRTLLDGGANLDVQLTPYADPDVESLSRSGLDWTATLPSDMAARVTQALGGHTPSTGVAWPAAGAISSTTLATLARAGARTLVLDSTAVSPSSDGGIPASSVRLSASGHRVVGALTSAALQQDAASALAVGGSGDAAVPALMSELAVRAVQHPNATQSVVLTPPRYIDPEPSRAERVIAGTAASPFTTPLALSSWHARPTAAATLRRIPASAPALPSKITDAASGITASLPSVSALLRTPGDNGRISPDAQTLLTDLPRGVQRIESSAWRPDAKPYGAEVGTAFASALSQEVRRYLTAVHIVPPRTGQYTLASNKSSLPVTVENPLDLPAAIQVNISAANGLPGFTGRPSGVKRIAAHSKQTIQVPVEVDRSGRIPVEADLQTTEGSTLGKSVPLFVHSTALGAIGVIITVTAGAVLVLALLLRFARRVRKRRRDAAKRRPAHQREPSGVDQREVPA